MTWQNTKVCSLNTAHLTTATAVSWFAIDTAHFCVHLYNIRGEASALLYGEEQSF